MHNECQTVYPSLSLTLSLTLSPTLSHTPASGAVIAGMASGEIIMGNAQIALGIAVITGLGLIYVLPAPMPIEVRGGGVPLKWDWKALVTGMLGGNRREKPGGKGKATLLIAVAPSTVSPRRSIPSPLSRRIPRLK